MAQKSTADPVYTEDLAGQIDATEWLPEIALPYWHLLNEWPVLGAITLVVIFYILALLTRIVFCRGAQPSSKQVFI